MIHHHDRAVLRCRTSYNKHGGYCVPSSSQHRPSAQTVLSGGVWEPHTIELICDNARGGDIIHAGTYFGDFLPALSRACGQDARVLAFEPNPENFRCAMITIQMNDLRNVDLSNAGLGSSRGVVNLRIADNHGTPLGGGSRVMGNDKYVLESLFTQVDMVRIDDLVAADRPVTVIHLDVEGSEKSALLGAIETIKRCKPILIVENVPDMKWLNQNLICIGYHTTGKVHNNTIMACS